MKKRKDVREGKKRNGEERKKTWRGGVKGGKKKRK